MEDYLLDQIAQISYCLLHTPCLVAVFASCDNQWPPIIPPVGTRHDIGYYVNLPPIREGSPTGICQIPCFDPASCVLCPRLCLLSGSCFPFARRRPVSASLNCLILEHSTRHPIPRNQQTILEVQNDHGHHDLSIGLAVGSPTASVIFEGAKAKPRCHPKENSSRLPTLQGSQSPLRL